ncbi:vesicle-associated membrane protein 5 [Pygocentrus nattereri]|uniref:vesicle-associated membrane protein 5 n=1 Tax=Pygocentrus nattereri TaxID=42514 RepID=UPI000814B417|nr:vesicle-associated membrane protein 5 [Pygocentrus nattereri]
MENGQSRLQQVQKDVDDVKVIMLDNLNKATEREGKLGDLEDRADVLLQESQKFHKTTVKVKQKKRRENMKWKLIMGGVIAVVIIVLIIILAIFLSGSNGNST